VRLSKISHVVSSESLMIRTGMLLIFLGPKNDRGD